MRLRRLGALIPVAVIALTAASSAAANPKRIGGIVPDVPSGGHVSRAHQPRAAERLSYGGGPVLHSNRAHLIFWQPAGSGLSFEPGYAALIERFLGQVAADSHMTSNVYGLSGQYHDATGPAAYASTYGGAVTDYSPLPANGCTEPLTGPPWVYCVNDTQLENELENVVRADHLPRTQNDVYFIVTPNGLGDCIDSSSSSCALGGSDTGYCGYHSQTMDGLLYAVIPYNAVAGHCQSNNPRPNGSTADPAISTISHEHNEMVTDPEEDAWLDSQGEEDGDLCIQNFGPALGGSGQGRWNEAIHGGHYYLQEEWSNENGGCAPRADPDQASFAPPGRLQAGKRLQLVGHGRAPHGSIVSFSWFFGDGAGGRGRTPTHIFRRAGTYRVVLRATDSADNWSYYARTVHVAKAPAHAKRAR
jgi:PKD domain